MSALAERFWAEAPEPVRALRAREPGFAAALALLAEHSQFLAEALLESPELALWLAQARRAPLRARDEWAVDLAAFTADLPPDARADALGRFRRRELLRIAARDLAGEAPLAETTQELAHLADAVLQQCYVWVWSDLAQRYGIPQGEAGAGAGLAVMALGKLGGEELNYSSDIDLMFLYAAEGETAGGGRSIANREFFIRLAQGICALAGGEAGGPAYRVDLRLRPGGREGDLALSLPAAIRYYLREAREWELQMLIRARVSAGAAALGERLLEAATVRVYPAAPDAAALAQGVRRLRQQRGQELERRRALRRQPPGEVDLKLDPGGIRDIEFLAQFLQRRYGAATPWVRAGNTLVALQRLHDKDRLSGREFQQLGSAYTLLRHLEHRLQLRLGQQTHTLPAAPAALAELAHSLRRAQGVAFEGGAGELQARVAAAMAAVRGLYDVYVGEAVPAPPPAIVEAGPGAGAGAHLRRQWQRLQRSSATWSDAPLPALAEAPPRLRHALEHSDWMAEAIIRRPALAAALAPETAPPEAFAPPAGADPAVTLAALRRWRQARTLFLLAEEWERCLPVTATLRAHTAVAESVLAAVWDLAGAPARAPLLAVLALGRLGLRELDLLSDLDLVFVAADAERAEAAAVAARIIQALTAYTQDGSLYPVDTRLRPGGGEGEMAQTPASLARYFRDDAGLWEAVSYLKVRVVAGDRELGGCALAAVREGLRARFAGRDCRAELDALRRRMEREGRPGTWGLKTPPGGFYDVDFIASRRYLEAGAVPPEGAGLAGGVRALPSDLLPPAVAAELAALAARLRAADHALRAATGKAGAAVPAAGESLARAWHWLARIAPGAPAGGAAAAVARVRALYDQWR